MATKSHSNLGAFISCVRVYSDGACLSNPGPAAIGAVLFDQAYAEIERVSEIIGTSTSNRSEYQALIAGLDVAAKHTRHRVECFLDNEIVVGQLSGRYRLISPDLRALYHIVKDLERPFTKVIYSRARKQDQRLSIAHKIAHDALNGRMARHPQ